jgi:hypothetical protein
MYPACTSRLKSLEYLEGNDECEHGEGNNAEMRGRLSVSARTLRETFIAPLGDVQIDTL